MCFRIFYEKTLFWAINTRSWKSGQIEIFPTGFVHDFGPKLAIFVIFFLGNLGQENAF